MWIGIDDTDSTEGGCTTHLGALVCSKFKTINYPMLVRLNPNIPYKTRGNGAVAINVRENGSIVKEFVLKLVEKHGRMQDENTNPGVVFIHDLNPGKKKLLHEFYLKTVSQLVTNEEAERLVNKIQAEAHKFNNGRGIIGALAAVGFSQGDKTYELIAYRSQNTTGPRRIDQESVFEMNARTYPATYDNIDVETGQLLITPHGPDPVFCGIRGENPGAVLSAWRMLRPLEEISLTQIFETNQGTDAHIRRKSISSLRPYDCVSILGSVTGTPRTIEGGHVLFEVSDGSGSICCAAYEPTGGLRRVVLNLALGDIVECLGGMGKYPNTVNLEKILVSRLVPVCGVVVPNCCGRKMTSAGKNKGHKCRKCGKTQRDLNPVDLQREIREGWYEAPPRARRHLSKPLIRQTQGFNTPQWE